MNVIVKRKNFTTITSEAIRDKRLSLKARGLLCFCMSLSDKWKYSISGLAAAAGVGVDTIKSSVKELEKCGYLVRNKYRDEHGRMACDYVISDQPIEGAKQSPETQQEVVGQDHQQSENEETNHGGKTTVEKPQRFSHHGSTAAENPPLSNINKYISKSIDQEVKTRSSGSSNNTTEHKQETATAATAKNAIAFWMNNTGQFGEVIRSDISDLTEQYGEAVVTEAMREAIRSNVRNIKYVTAIVERMASGKERTAKGETTGNAWSAAFEKLYGGGVENVNDHGEERS